MVSAVSMCSAMRNRVVSRRWRRRPGFPNAGGMWGAAAAYFQLLSGDNMYLPGGRYSCAQELQARDLAFLQGCSLGRVCHIVQLAISQKKLLGYLNGAVVPYAFSQSMVKEQCAQLNTVCIVSSTASGGIEP